MNHGMGSPRHISRHHSPLPLFLPRTNSSLPGEELEYDYNFLTRVCLLAGGIHHLPLLSPAGLVVVSIIGNTLAIHKLTSRRMSEYALVLLLLLLFLLILPYIPTFSYCYPGKKRTTTLFLHLALADCLVTIFPMAGDVYDIL